MSATVDSESLNIVCPHCGSVVRVPEARVQDNPVCPRCKSAVLPGEPVALDAGSFDTHIGRSSLPVLVDFWAPWCGPCRMMAPVLDRAAEELSTQLRVAKVNTDEQPQLAARYGIRSIPTLILFREGREIARQSGALEGTRLRQWLSGAIDGLQPAR
jgi:thioredoxin 2